MLIQYGNGYQACLKNPNAGGFLRTNALFDYNTKTQDLSMIYQAKKGEQIAGFSINNNKLYLLRSD